MNKCKCGNKIIYVNMKFCKDCSLSIASRNCLLASCIYDVKNGADWFCKHHEKVHDRNKRSLEKTCGSY